MKNITYDMWALVPQILRPSKYERSDMARIEFFHGKARSQIRFISNLTGRCVNKSTGTPDMDNLESMNKNKSYQIGKKLI